MAKTHIFPLLLLPWHLPPLSLFPAHTPATASVSHLPASTFLGCLPISPFLQSCAWLAQGVDSAGCGASSRVGDVHRRWGLAGLARGRQDSQLRAGTEAAPLGRLPPARRIHREEEVAGAPTPQPRAAIPPAAAGVRGVEVFPSAREGELRPGCGGRAQACACGPTH